MLACTHQSTNRALCSLTCSSFRSEASAGLHVQACGVSSSSEPAGKCGADAAQHPASKPVRLPSCSVHCVNGGMAPARPQSPRGRCRPPAGSRVGRDRQRSWPASGAEARRVGAATNRPWIHSRQIHGPGWRWRRGWDSNPRYARAHNGFRDRPDRPLWHLSTPDAYRTTRNRPATAPGYARAGGVANPPSSDAFAQRVHLTRRPARPNVAIPEPKEPDMAWKSPKIIEIALGAEINSYACAEAK